MSNEDKPKVPSKEIEALKPLSEIEQKELELKQAEIDFKLLEIQSKKLDLQDISERLQERAAKRETVSQRAKTNGVTLNQNAKTLKATQDRCNHKKGGNGLNGIVAGQGDDFQYAVIKHTVLNGDLWIRCQRCAKHWKPPVKSQHKAEESYLAAYEAYNVAKNFQTRNTPSGSYIFQFSDPEWFREVTKDVNLK